MTKKYNGRRYMRIKPDRPVIAELVIASIGERRVVSGKAGVVIEDISTGGIGFLSNLSLPVDKTVVIELSFSFLESSYNISGRIIHKYSVGIGEYFYGFSFIKPEKALKPSLRQLFSSMLVKIDSNVFLLKSND